MSAAPRRDDGSWLYAATGRTPAWWVAFVQSRIAKRSSPSADPKHDQTDPRWLQDVAQKVQQTMPSEGRYDPNMRAAAVLAMVLATWFLRLQRAKAFDPRRPIADRQAAYAGWLGYVREFQMLPIDEREDHAFFNGQEWESPFDPDAHDGDFR